MILSNTTNANQISTHNLKSKSNHKQNENVLRFVLSAIRGELLEREIERERKRERKWR